MTRTRVDLVARDFTNNIRRATYLTAATSHAKSVSGLRFRDYHCSMITELAYLTVYLAWEHFVEQSFILYMLGKPSPRGTVFPRYVMPPDREHALQLARGDGRFTDWGTCDMIVAGAKRFLRDGDPYTSAVQPMTNTMNDTKTIRNAMAHKSSESHQKFETLVRKELGFLPSGMTVGLFLEHVEPSSVPPRTFLDRYVAVFQTACSAIAP